MFLKSRGFLPFNLIGWKVSFVFMVSLFLGPIPMYSQTESLEKLALQKPLERTISDGDKHEFALDLTKGNYAEIEVVDPDVDLKIWVDDPSKKNIFRIKSSSGDNKAETVKIYAELNGVYQIAVGHGTKGAKPGKYRINLIARRSATSKDVEIAKAFKMNLQMRILEQTGKADAALELGKKIIAIYERTGEKDGLPAADVLSSLGNVYHAKGKFKLSEESYLRTLAIYKKLKGARDVYVGTIHNNMGVLYRDMGQFQKAETSLTTALDIQEEKLGKDHTDVAQTLGNFGYLYHALGQYSKAEGFYLRSLAIDENRPGGETPNLAYTINNLSVIYQQKGDYQKAETYLRRAITILEKHLTRNHPTIAILLTNLASIADLRGDLDASGELLYEALGINEKAYGKDHYIVGVIANNIAVLHDKRREFDKSEPLLKRTLEINKKAYGLEHPRVAISLKNLGIHYRHRGEYEKATPYFKKAIEIEEKKIGENHYAFALSLQNLGLLHLFQEEYVEAEVLLRRALGIFENANGPEHPYTARPLRDLATLFAAKRDFTQALAFQERYISIRNRNLDLNLFSGSERQKLTYTRSISSDLSSTISLQTDPQFRSVKADKLALDLILSRKGRILDAMAESISVLRRNELSENSDLIAGLSSVRSKLANLTLRGGRKGKSENYLKKLKSLDLEKETLERKLSSQSAEYELQRQPITVESVSKMIPKNAALIELVVYLPKDFRSTTSDTKKSVTKYIAYVLGPNGETKWVELGTTEEIDRLVDSYRQAINDPKRKDVKKIARVAYGKLMKPIRELLGDAKHLLISPDGQLNLMPFEALVNEEGKYLVETFSITYLSSGRDLGRMQISRDSKTKPVLIANPAFGAPLPKAETVSRNALRRSVTAAKDLSDTYFAALEGTKREADSIKSIFPSALFLNGKEATEAALKQVESPRILHLATHGFFLQDSKKEIKNPLLRSGLAFAGANQRKSGDEDGILTALEASGLNLWGTKLVVLSACDTGLGEVQNGEGVYGLRRAFTIAGTESLVMSLWAVSDNVTRELMTDYYKNLKAGMGRNEALRQVQLAMIKKKTRQHPFYWASFIQSGEWANLDGTR